MTRLLASICTTALLLFAAPAPAHADTVTAHRGGAECWGKGRTLQHFVIFNSTSRQVRYVMTWTAGSRTRSSTGRIPRAQGVNEGIIIKRGQVVDRVEISVRGVPVFLASGIAGKGKCARR